MSVTLTAAFTILGSVTSAGPLQRQSFYFGESVLAYAEANKKGLLLFSKVWEAADGAGSRFNQRSCVACHSVPMPGGSGIGSTTFVSVDAEGPDRDVGHIVQRFEQTDIGVIGSSIDGGQRRRTPALFGAGFLEAALVDEPARPTVPDAIVGRKGGYDGTPGRFGWKGRVSDLRAFTDMALRVEIGLLPAKIKASDYMASLDTLTEFVRYLEVPPRKLPLTEAAIHGERLFGPIGCAQCHTPTLKIDASSPLARYRPIVHPYSDLLLHDMGVGLSDGITEGLAGVRDFRTPPLWGLSSTGPPYLHDGRAMSIDSAIELHGGEAERTTTRYKQLSITDRQALIAFLNSL